MPLIGPSVFGTGSFAAERRSYGELKAELARPSDADDDTTLAMAGDSLNSAIRAFNRFHWPWERLTLDITTIPGQETYALPQPFKAELAAYRLVNNRPRHRLQFIPYDQFLTQYSLDYDGIPVCYTLGNQFETGSVTIWPRPTSAETIRLDYFRFTPTMRTDDATLEVPSHAEEAIMSWARWLLLGKLSGSNPNSIAAAREDAIRARAELVAFCANRSDVIGAI